MLDVFHWIIELLPLFIFVFIYRFNSSISIVVCCMLIWIAFGLLSSCRYKIIDLELLIIGISKGFRESSSKVKHVCIALKSPHIFGSSSMQQKKGFLPPLTPSTF